MAQGVNGTVTLPLMLSTAQWDKLLEIAEAAEVDWDAVIQLMIDEAKIISLPSVPGASLSINVRVK